MKTDTINLSAPGYLDTLPENTIWCFEETDGIARLRAHKATPLDQGTYLEETEVTIEIEAGKDYSRFRMFDTDRAAVEEWVGRKPI